jgi:hypothetical protein
VCSDVPDEPRYRLELAEELAKGDEREVAEARTIYESFAGGERGQILAADALEALIRLDAVANDYASVRTRLDRALSFALDDETRRKFEAMDLALRAGGFSGYFLRAYFFAGGDDLAWAFAAAILDGDSLAWYLAGIQAHVRDHHHLAAIALTIAFGRGLPSPRFVRNGARRLAVSAWRAGDLAAVDVATSALDTSVYETDRALAADWRERKRFTSR